MHKCPHCQQQEISSWQKAVSLFFGPAICSMCYEKSYLHITYGLLAMGTWVILTWVFIGLSYMSGASFFLLGTIPAAVIAFNKFILQAPLTIVSSKP